MPESRRTRPAGALVASISVLLSALLLRPAVAVAHPVTAPDPADSVVVVVAAENPLDEMTRLHLADLYLGRAASFEDGRRAVPIDLAPGTPARTAFYERYLERTPAEIKAHWSRIIFTGRGRPPPDLPSGEAVKRRIAGDPGAIGYLDASLVDESVRVVRIR